MAAEVEFEAPSTAGEYKVIVQVRSSSMIGVDAKRKVAFVVNATKGKRGGNGPSVTSSGTSESGTSEEAHGDDDFLPHAFGYALALAGCYCQWQWGFAPPFPINLVLLPFSLVEWWIRWALMPSAAGL